MTAATIPHHKQVSQQQVTITRPLIKPLDLSIIKPSRRPKLTINTHSLTPLFFTQLSTHYTCKNEEEEENGFLIPVMSY
ncbi:uncharacterized protein BX663DRAFT_518459 [Cokeromyces recurvatus]|uniref:uncharacterized protein n=1 Tax=Cokeromyces recurvatus TaxID=90255 RepID=UPI002220FB30|nr:uncharacterized protein BX663DRAFT_518459 [Cokeromyces recurvatus]KAI7900068.1 hypothetical protein BX663DRAFT_518459 [Cokeromyces recurvatus]